MTEMDAALTLIIIFQMLILSEVARKPLFRGVYAAGAVICILAWFYVRIMG